MKYCNKCENPAFDEQNFCQKCGNNKFVKSIKKFEKRKIKEENKEQIKQKLEQSKDAITEKAMPVVKEKTLQAKDTLAEKAVPFLKENAVKIKDKGVEIVGNGTKEEKAKNIFSYLKELFCVRFVKFLKNYKKFKQLPKQSKIKHICFPVVMALFIAIATSPGGSTRGLSNDEATAVLACSALSSDMQSAASYGVVDQVYFGSLADVFEITDVQKEKGDDGDFVITLTVDYKIFGGGSSSGTLIFNYNPENKKATVTGGSALSGLRSWAQYEAVN